MGEQSIRCPGYLGKYGPRFYFVSPEELRMPTEITAELDREGIEVIETTNLAEAASKSDVLYMTRIQKERFENQVDYERLKGAYVVNPELIQKSKTRNHHHASTTKS